jgi:outer membrane protein assembly factor BamB
MRTATILTALLLTVTLVSAEDWPAYRGSRGDGVSSEKIAGTLPAGGAKLLWKVPITSGLSSFAVAGGKVFTTMTMTNAEQREEVCVALDAATGKKLWSTVTGPVTYKGGGDSGAPGNRGGDGPRSTPTVSDGKVYVYSAAMTLTCLDAATGKALWSKDILKGFAGKNIGWSSAMSPVVAGELVYVAGGGAGQAMLAFRKGSGELAWKAGTDTMTHATPVVASIHGVQQVIYIMQSGLVAVSADGGKPLWSHAFPFRTATACSPVVAGNTVFITAAYDVGGAACEVSKQGDAFAVREVWRDKGNATTASLWSTPVAYGGHLYGMISGKKYGTGPLKCVDLKTAQLKWEQPGFGAGNVILSGNTLIALSDDGHVALVEATPDGYREKGRFKAVDGKCWSTPALSNGRLYVRSTLEGACYELSGK